jgi:OOP family OmpA-OmpF porin
VDRGGCHQENARRLLPGAYCPAQIVACGEVELVHGGNEFNQQGWRHAKPYIQIAEDSIGASRAAAERCAPSVQVVDKGIVVEPAPVAMAPKPVDVSANVLFNFDKRDMQNVRELTRQKLDELITRITSGEITVTSIALVGNADRSNNTGDQDYNVKLSIDRANVVREYMVGRGIERRLITTTALADKAPVQGCDEQGHTVLEFRECLLPNRRVEVHVLGTHGVPVRP